MQFYGKPGYFVPYIWVDNDFTLIRGSSRGSRKSLGGYTSPGSTSEPEDRVEKVGRGENRHLRSNAQRIVEGLMTFTRKAKPSESSAREFNLSAISRVVDDELPAVHELRPALSGT